MADAMSFPTDDKKPKLALIVINRGDTPTVLTHMIAYIYASRWGRWRGRKAQTALVNSPNIPGELGINRTWQGLMIYDQDTTEARAKGLLYVGVISSHSNREFLIRVPLKKTMTLPTNKM
jgi:hypothetical protein